jgi:hypothetical protein
MMTVDHVGKKNTNGSTNPTYPWAEKHAENGGHKNLRPESNSENKQWESSP